MKPVSDKILNEDRDKKFKNDSQEKPELFHEPDNNSQLFTFHVNKQLFTSHVNKQLFTSHVNNFFTLVKGGG